MSDSRLLHLIRVSVLPFRNSMITAFGFLVACQGLGELGPRSYRRSFPVEDVNRESDEESKNGKYGGRPFQLVLLTYVLVD